MSELPRGGWQEEPLRRQGLPCSPPQPPPPPLRQLGEHAPAPASGARTGTTLWPTSVREAPVAPEAPGGSRRELTQQLRSQPGRAARRRSPAVRSG